MTHRRILEPALALLLLVAAACGDDGGRTTAAPTSTSAQTSVTGPPPEDSAAAARSAALGEITRDPSAPPDAACPEGFTCSSFEVRCPDVSEAAEGYLAVRPVDVPVGVVVLLSGGSGSAWWSDYEGENDITTTLDALAAEGLTLVQVKWATSWATAPAGAASGVRLLACRPATVLAALADDFGDLRPAAGGCGFCVTGNSAGAVQAVEALTSYGVNVDRVVASSGPAHAALAVGCLQLPGEESLWYSAEEAARIDQSYGARPGTGPCSLRDASFDAKFQADSLGAPVEQIRSKVALILGAQDTSAARAQAETWARSGNVPIRSVDGMGHEIQASPAGLDVLVEELTR